MATSSSSSFTYGWTYDVFISFRGADTRLGFTGNLYIALRGKGISTFMDDQDLEPGAEITPALDKAIQESRIALVIFSKNYAESNFCLEEVAKIVECSKEKGMLVWPVFYQVDPSDVRYQKGRYAEALAKHEGRFEKEKIEKWRAALKKAADRSGSHFRSDGYQYEYQFIDKIIQDISKKINSLRDGDKNQIICNVDDKYIAQHDRDQTLSLEIEHEFVQNSERVKSVDLHPTEPWILAGLYSGTISIWNYQTMSEEKSLKISELGVRSAKFIARERWVVAASDDKYIRVYNYDKMKKIAEFEGHKDYIRSLAVHPSLPYVVSASDDKVIKLWGWSKGWACHRTFEGHSHYVMQVAFNRQDPNTIVSASLDGTLKIWSLDSSTPNFTLDGHLKGVNCVDYFISNDKKYLLSGSDDYTVKVWDYHSRSCVQTLEGHGNNVTAVCAHLDLPIIITASEDSTVKIWDAVTYRLHTTLNFGLERVWSIGYKKGTSLLAFGCDKGFVIVKVILVQHLPDKRVHNYKDQTLSLEIEHEFVQNSERVKSVDLHPTEPWILAGLYSGTISIWNYQTMSEEKSLKISELAVRSAKFIALERWVVAASDDKYIRVYNYGKMKKIAEFEGHKDYIRSLAVHPSLPYVVSASDDKVIKLWGWSKGWACHRTFEGHSHYVMQVAFNRQDPNTFVSASLDGTLKIWSLDSSTPNFTLDGHLKGVNCVDYFISNDKKYLLSGSDDYTVKGWDYHSRSCVQTLEGHGNNVTAVCAHLDLPIIITASEDSTVKIWDAVTYRLHTTLNFGLERVWSIGYKKGTSLLAFGCDKGFVIVKVIVVQHLPDKQVHNYKTSHKSNEVWDLTTLKIAFHHATKN